MTQTSETKPKKSFWRKYFLFGLPSLGFLGAFAAGIVFWGGFNTAMEATNSMAFCISCHEMEDNVYAEYQGTVHDVNRSGVGAVCSDCHVPQEWTHKVIRKIQASREVWGMLVGTIATPELFDAERLDLAMHEWERMKATDSRECRNCHDYDSMLPEAQAPRARQQHMNALTVGQTCIDCHKGIAHLDVRDRADPEYLEALEAPNPEFIREITQDYLDSLARAEAADAAEAAARRAEADANQARIVAAVEAARADERAIVEAEMAGQAVEESAGGNVAPNVDWDAVDSTNLTLFYPGQASFEWVQNGDHGGSRPLTKGGDACTTCHASELETIGNSMVSGGELEPTPIPGKRGTIDANLQATHDDENVYFRLQWLDAGHNPAPFVEGGMMDPDNQIKVAMMFTGTGIEFGEQVGCWATCHADNTYMPYAPDAEALAANPDVLAQLGATDTITKFLSESRTEIDVKGRRGAPLGGWANLETEEAIEQYLADGTFMDLLRVYADGSSSNGYIMDRRVENDGEMAAEANLSADGTWTVIFSRPLASDAVGDIALEAGTTYTVGFAIHDDYASARFHHVTLNTSLALDDPSAMINVIGQ